MNRGASVGSTKIEIDDSTSGIEFSGSDVGWKVFGRYMFNDNWGIEAGYVDLGKPDDTIMGVDIEVKADGFDGSLVGAVPVSDTVELFGKTGVAVSS